MIIKNKLNFINKFDLNFFIYILIRNYLSIKKLLIHILIYFSIY